MEKQSLSSDQLLLHHERLRALVSNLLMDDDDVEDVLQEVWIAALRKRPWRFRVLGAWLTRVARNLAIRSRRDRHLRATREQNAAHTRSLPLHDMDAQRQEVLASVTRAASTLKEPYKTVIALRFFEGLTIGEISDQLETPYDTVRSRLKSALVQMRAMLKRELGKERASWCLGLLSLLPESEWASVAGKTGALATSAEGAAVLAAKAKIVIAVMVCCGALAVFWGSRTRTLPSELPTTRSSIQPRVETAVAPTKTTTAAPVTETAPGQKPAPIPPDVMKQAYIHGIVTDLNGRPVSGATVRASRALNSMFGGTRNKVFTTRSNEKGEYFLGPLVDGAMGRGYRWWVVEASSPGFFKKRRPACQGVELDFQLGPPARLTGCVTHAMDGRPSARAEVTVISRAFSDECKSILYFKELHQLSGSVGPRWKKATDENGSFDFGDLPPGWYSLSVYPTDRKPYTADPEVELLAGVETRTSLVLPVYKKVRVTGRVLDRETGAPVKGYTLASAANPNQQAVTDEDGRYEIRGLGREQNTITGSGAGFVSGRKDMVFVTQSVHEQDFRPGRWARIRGRVLGCDGVPLAGAQVGCNQFAAVVDTSVTARTDEHGIFDHRKALFGKGVRIYAAAGGHAIGISDEMDIQPGEVKTDIEIHLTRGGTVEGRIEDMAGQPVLDGALILRDMKTADKPLITPWIYLHPSDRGRFRFEHVPPGTYMVVGKSAENIRPYTAIQVLEGGTTSVVLTPRRGERIAGRIQNEAGRPLPGVQVQARVASCRAIGPKIYTLPDGTFRFDGIQRGVYDLLLNTPGYFSKILENIRTGNTDIQATLHPWTSLTGRVLMRDTRQPVAIPFWLRFFHQTPGMSLYALREYRNTRGRITGNKHHGMTAGTYDIEAGTDTGLISQRITGVVIGPGSHAKPLEFLLDRGGRLEGTVKDPEGNPLLNARVDVLPAGGPSTTFLIRTGTDQDGHFDIGVLRPGTYSVEVMHPQWASAFKNVHISPGQSREVDLILGHGVRLDILVQDPVGHPVQDAMIIVKSGDRESPGSARWRGRLRWKTDAEGRLSLQELKPGMYWIRAMHPAWVRTTRLLTVASGSDMVIHVRLGKGGSIHIQIRKDQIRKEVTAGSRPGRPIANAHVSFSDDDGEVVVNEGMYFDLFMKALENNPDLWWDDYVRSLERTDRTGVLERRFLPPGRYTVKISAPGFKPSRQNVLVEDELVTPLRIQLEPLAPPENRDG